ncbi:MAG: hypothetical protein HQ541_14170 [Mariniphaga sp.]|nr:hypothetical protein [Mariniphaga sp.]
MEDYKKEIYASLGLLSIKFAIMEYNLIEILINLINNEEDLITLHLIEKNNITRNIEFIEKINKIKSFYPDHINNLLSNIKHIKRDRNLLIHGLWKEPYESKNDVEVLCEERKIKYTEQKTIAGLRKTWNHNSFKNYRLSYIKKLIVKIDDIILAQNHIIKLQDEN